MWDLIVSVPDHCLSFYFENCLLFLVNLFYVNVYYVSLFVLCSLYIVYAYWYI